MTLHVQYYVNCCLSPWSYTIKINFICKQHLNEFQSQFKLQKKWNFIGDTLEFHIFYTELVPVRIL